MGTEDELDDIDLKINMSEGNPVVKKVRKRKSKDRNYFMAK